jgi:1,4-dihydroxy-2-naphthoate polyprenyltransferase
VTTAIQPSKLGARLAEYERAVVCYLDPNGYPVNVATGFHVDEAGLVHLDTFDAPDAPTLGSDVELIFSHVRPRPKIGYDERRYINVWGTLGGAVGARAVVPTRVSGWSEERLPFVEYCERNVPRAHRYLRRLSEERGSTVQARLPLRWRLFLATRLPFLTATIVPVLLGAVIARAHGYSAWWFAAAAFIGAVCIHLGLNVLNDIFDTSSGADQANVTPTPFSGGSRMILYGLATQRWMRGLAIGLFAVGIGIGIGLAVLRASEILWLGMAGIFLSVFYTAPPVKLVHRGLGDIAVALGFGPIMTLGTYAVVARTISFEALFASLPVGILVMLILYVNQVPDRRGDAASGKRTVAVRFSREAIVRGYDVLVAAAFGLIVVGAAVGVMPRWTLLGCVAAPLAIRVHRGLKEHYDEPYGLVPALAANIGVHLLAGVGLIGAYVLSVVLR